MFNPGNIVDCLPKIYYIRMLLLKSTWEEAKLINTPLFVNIGIKSPRCKKIIIILLTEVVLLILKGIQKIAI